MFLLLFLLFAATMSIGRYEDCSTGSIQPRRASPAAIGSAITRSRTEKEGMAKTISMKVNGRVQKVTASPDTPLLYVLHNELHLHGPRFGCGLAQCGACSVLADGKEIRSCVT